MNADSKEKHTIPLGSGDSRLFERLAQILPDYMEETSVQTVLSELRDTVYVDVTAESVRDLHVMTLNCHRCPNMRDPILPAWNLVDPDVLFVIDMRMTMKAAKDLLIKTLKNCSFSSKKVGLTYVNRCMPTEKRKATEEEVTNCLPYLHSEIQILRPKLIVTLGLIAAQSILGPSMQLNEERGTIHWLGPWAVLPTYTPAYVINGGGNIESIFKSDMQSAYEYVYGSKIEG